MGKKPTRVLICVLILAGCLSTKMSTYTDPTFPEIIYKSVLVASNFQSLDDEKYIEERVCVNLSNYDAKCQVASMYPHQPDSLLTSNS